MTTVPIDPHLARQVAATYAEVESIRRTARMYHLDKDRVRLLIESCGERIKPRITANLSAENVARAVAAYRSGINLDTTAKILHCSREKTRKLLNDNGLMIRSQGSPLMPVPGVNGHFTAREAAFCCAVRHNGISLAVALRIYDLRLARVDAEALVERHRQMGY